MTDAAAPARVLSLTARFAAATALILAAGGVIVTVAALAYGHRAADQAYDRLLIGAANQIAASVRVQQGAVVVDLPVTAFELLALAPDERILYRVLGPSGATITGHEQTPEPPGGRTFYEAEVDGTSFRFATIERRFAERAFSGTVQVLVGQTTRARQALAWQITRSALVVLAVAGVAMVGLAVFAIRSALGPLGRIERSLAARDPHDLTPLDLAVPRETAATVAAINRFMARLERQMSAMRRLIADSAHQLRTPVAALRAQAELAADEADPVRQRAIVARIHRRSLGLSRLTDQLLSRALVIHRADAAPHQALDLRTVAIAVAEASDHEAYGAADQLRLDLPDEPVPVVGDALSLGEACKNLVNNAFRHGAPPVTLAVRADGATGEIAVTDRGAGIPAEKRAARLDAPASGGLGIAIAAAVVADHGGELRFRDDPAGGFTAALAIPLRDARS